MESVATTRGLSENWADTKKTEEYVSEIKKLLESNPKIVDFLGEPFLMQDDDSYWKWWEFTVFDGEQWAVFHVNDHLEVSLESQSPDAEGGQRRERQAKAVHEEFPKPCGKSGSLELA